MNKFWIQDNPCLLTICIWKIYQLFCDSGAALVDFLTFMKMLPNISFISMVIKQVFLSVWIATISNFLHKCTLWRHNYGTSQPKIGQEIFGKRSIIHHIRSVVEFQRWWVLKSKLFGHESTYSKDFFFFKSINELRFIKNCQNHTFKVNFRCQKSTECFQKIFHLRISI